PHGLNDGPGTQRTHPLAEQRVAPLVTEPAQLLVDSLRGDVGMPGQQVGDRPYVGIELTASGRAALGWSRRGTGTADLLDLVQRSFDRAAADPQALGDPAH